MAKKCTRIPFEADHVYHLFNRGNNREKLFYSPDDYQMFLEYFRMYPGTLAETYAYCLIPNHFHFLLRIKMIPDEKEFVRSIRIWLIKYAMKINRRRDRRGHLFTRPINRILIDDEVYLKNIIRYIHLNPTRHGLNGNYQDHPYSSYRQFLSKDPGEIISRDEALKLFNNDYMEFIDYHKFNSDDEEIDRFIIEDKG